MPQKPPPLTDPPKDASPIDGRMQELLDNIHTLSDEELDELKSLIMAALDKSNSKTGPEETDNLESLAAAVESVQGEYKRRKAIGNRRDRAEATIAAFVPEDRRPRFYTRRRSDRAVTASGHEITDDDGVAREFVDAIRRLPSDRRPGADGHKVVVATVHADRPYDRTLRRSDSAEMVTDVLTAAAVEHIETRRHALTAAGGLGAPEAPDYTLPGFETKDRPVKSALPGLTADRGGIRFVKPPNLADVNGALGIWTVPDDIAAATNPAIRKPALRVTPNNEVVVDIQAITNTLVFGNMMTNAFPEYIQRVVDLTMGAHARIAEQQLVTQIGGLSTSVTGALVPSGGRLGATRVLLPLLDRAATGMRDRLRSGPEALLQLILPAWARPLLRSDLAVQEPGDATLGVTNADLEAYFTARSLSVTWALDGEAGQQFNPQAPGAVNAWPDRIISYLFPAGAHQFLDGGSLDLGLVRDSTLNAANDYMMFSETFEAVAYRGGESMRISQPVMPSGIARAAEAGVA